MRKGIPLLLGIVVVILLVLITALSRGPMLTARVVGYTPPFPCTTTFNINSTDYLEIPPGGSAEVDATIWAVRCGLSHVILEIEDIPESWYNVSPNFIASIGPPQTGTFTISFEIPENAEEGVYVGSYLVKSGGTNYVSESTIELKIAKPLEKPKVQIAEIEFEEEFDKGLVMYIVTFAIIIVSIVIVASEYFEKPLKEAESGVGKVLEEEELIDTKTKYKKRKD